MEKLKALAINNETKFAKQFQEKIEIQDKLTEELASLNKHCTIHYALMCDLKALKEQKAETRHQIMQIQFKLEVEREADLRKD